MKRYDISIHFFNPSLTLHIQAAVSAAATSPRCCAMTPPQKTGSRPGTSRHRELSMVYPHQEPRSYSVPKVFKINEIILQITNIQPNRQKYQQKKLRKHFGCGCWAWASSSHSCWPSPSPPSSHAGTN